MLFSNNAFLITKLAGTSFIKYGEISKKERRKFKYPLIVNILVFFQSFFCVLYISIYLFKQKGYTGYIVLYLISLICSLKT